LFESSEVPEKRQILKLLLQNPTVNGKKLEFSIGKPFNIIADVKGSPIGLRTVEAVRTWIYASEVDMYVPLL
tara:strand:- start:60 stop:275 length:216 start_codon:yes stop_codon:yes gene_type:complete